MCVFLIFPSLMCGEMDSLGAPDWERERQTRKTLQTENVPKSDHHVAEASWAAIVQSPLSSSGQTKGTIRDLEIPESFGCG